MTMQQMRKSKNARLIILVVIIAITVALWFWGDKNNNKFVKTAAIVTGGVAGLATGLEIADTDYDLKKLWETGSLKESLMKRDADGNLLNIGMICYAQNEGYYNYNCDDFTTQSEAQSVYDQCSEGQDTFGLDRDKDGKVCESLPVGIN